MTDNTFSPAVENAVLLLNGFSPDEYWIDTEGAIYSLDGDVLMNEEDRYWVRQQLKMISLISEKDLEVFNSNAFKVIEGDRDD